MLSPEFEADHSSSALLYLSGEAKKYIDSLSKLAYYGMLEDRFVFAYSELTEVFPETNTCVDIESCCFGLITCFINSEENYYYQFLHLSIQEFLAARYMCIADTFTGEKQQTFFMENLKNVRYRLMLLFLAGFTKLNILSPQKIIHKDIYAPELGVEHTQQFLFLGHLIFESRNFNLYKYLTEGIEGLSFEFYELTLFDCMIIAHFLCSTKCSWKKLNLASTSLSYRSIEVFTEVSTKYNDNKTIFCEVDLSRNEPDLIVGIAKMPWLLQTKRLNLSQAVSTISESHKKNGTNMAKSLIQLLHRNANFEEVDLSWSKQLSESDSGAMGNAFDTILRNNTTLKVLDLHGGSINDTIAKGVASGLTRNKCLEKLNIDNNMLSDGVITEILSAVNSNNSLCFLQLCGVQLLRSHVDRGWELLPSSHTKLSCFFSACTQASFEFKMITKSELNLSWANINSDGAVSIFKSLEHNTTLRELDLSENKLMAEGDSEAVGRAIERMLKVNTTLKVLDLHGDSVNDTIAKGITAGLRRNSSLVKLNIKNNVLSDNIIADILISANSNYTICSIDICSVNISRNNPKERWNMQFSTKTGTSQYFLFLVQIMNDDTVIGTSTDINRLDSDLTSGRAIVILQTIEHNTSVKQLVLSNSSQILEGNSEGVGHAIEKMLQNNTTLLVLDLHNSCINNTIAKCIAAGLALNCSLEKINMENNSVSDIVTAEILTSANSSKSLCSIDLCGIRISRNHPWETWNMEILTTVGMSQFLCVLVKSLMNVQTITFVEAMTLDSDITSSRAVIILQVLERNNSLKELDLSENKQITEGNSEEVGQAFEKMLQSNTALKVLDLHGGSINDTIAKSIAIGLNKNSSVEKIDLSENQKLAENQSWAVGSAVNRMLQSNTALKVLDLHGCSINDIIAEKIATGLNKNSSLEKLDLSENQQLVTNESLEVRYAIERMLQDNTTLKELNLHGSVNNTIAKGIAVGLHENSSLEKLNIQLGKNSVILRDDVMVQIISALNSNSSLCSIDLCGVRISRTQPWETWSMEVLTMIGMSQFLCVLVKSLVNVQTITLIKAVTLHCDITSIRAVIILQILEHNTSLQELDLSKNSQIKEGNSEEVGQAFEKMLQNNTALKVLDLHGGSINDTIAKSIASGLSNNSSLKSIKIYNNTLSDMVIVEILSSAASNNALCSIDLCYGVCISRPQPKETWDMRILPKIVLSQFLYNIIHSIMNIQVRDLLLMPDITCSRAEIILQTFENNTSLEKLDLSKHMHPTVLEDESKAVGKAVKKMLQVNKTLKELYAGGLVNRTVVQGIMAGMTSNTSLKILNLSGNHQLAEGDTESMGCDIKRMLQFNTTIKVFELRSVSINDAIAINVATGLIDNTTLEILDLSENQHLAVGNSKAVGNAIEVMLQANTALKVLDLHGGSINDTVTISIATGLSVNRSLVRLDLSENQNLAVGNSEAVGKAIELMLKVNTTLKVLDLHGGSVNHTITISVASGLTVNKSLENLDLSNNQQLAEGKSEAVGNAIELMLKVNTTLKVLDLHGGSANDTIAISVASGLTVNKSLKNLDLSDNQQLAEGNSEAVGNAIAQMLQANTTLNILGLRSCCISVIIAKSITVGLAKNVSLDNLDLSENQQLSKDDSNVLGCSIERMLKDNTTLKVLDLHGSIKLDETTAKSIAAGLSKNSSLEALNIDNMLSDFVITEILSSANSHNTLTHLKLGGVQLIRVHCNNTWKLFPIGKAKMALLFSALHRISLKVKLVINAIHQVDSNHKSITSDGDTSIFQSLESNTVVEGLDFSYNKQLTVDESQAVSVDIKRMLQANTTLYTLDIHGIFISDTIVKGIIAGLTKNSSLNSLNIDTGTLSHSVVDEILLSANSHKILCSLHLCGFQLIRTFSDNCWDLLSIKSKANIPLFISALHRTSLKFNIQIDSELNLSWANITSDVAVSVFKSLEKNTTLKVLNLSENTLLAKGDSEAVGYAIKRMFHANATLQKLNLSAGSSNDNIAKGIAAGLIKNSSLENLNLDNNLFSDVVIAEIFTSANSSKSLCSIDLCGIRISRTKQKRKWDLQILTKLGISQFLFVLAQISFNILMDKKMNEIKFNFDITSSRAVIILQTLKHNTTVKELDLSRANIQLLATGNSVEVSLGFQQMLQVNTTLQMLDLHHCFINNTIAEGIAAGLSMNSSIKRLNLNYNDLSDMVVAKILSSANSNNTLCEVQVCGATLGRSHSKSSWELVLYDKTQIPLLFSALNQTSLKFTMSTVYSLNLSHANITGDFAMRIFQSLEHNTNLTELDLSENHSLARIMSDSEAVGYAFKKMLQNSRNLRALDLHGRSINDAILKGIAEGLTKCSSLLKLDLSRNSLLPQYASNAEYFAIEEMLLKNTALQTLIFHSCDLSSPVLFYLCKGLSQNTSLKNLDMNRIHYHIKELDLSEPQSAKEQQTKAGHPRTLFLNPYRFLIEPFKFNLNFNKEFSDNKSPSRLDELCCLVKNSKCDNEAAGNAVELMLLKNKTLESLELSACYNLPSTVFVHLIEGLCHNTSLIRLDISHNNLSKCTNIDDTTERMFQLNKTLQVLCLRNCNLPSTLIVHLFEGLSSNISLKQLDISNNQLETEDTLTAMAKMLASNNSLTELNVRECWHRPKARYDEDISLIETRFKFLAERLSASRSLKKLIVSANIEDALLCYFIRNEYSKQGLDIKVEP